MIKPRRCGSCGNQKLQLINYKGKMLPTGSVSVFINLDLELWSCIECGERASVAGDAKHIGEVVRQSIRDVSRQCIMQIIQKSGIRMRDLAMHLGVSPNHLSSVKTGKETPSMPLYKLIVATAKYPEQVLESTSPDFNPAEANLLLYP